MTSRSEAAPAREPVLNGAAFREVSFRLRLAAYLVLLALLPIGAAYWVFGEFAVRTEVEQTDARLNAVVRAAVGEFRDELDAAEARATRIARRPAIQRALASGDRAALARFAREHPQVAFSVGSATVGRREGDLAVRRGVDVVVGQRGVGHVSVAVPLDPALRGRLEARTSRGSKELLAIVRDGRVVAAPSGLAGEASFPAGRPGNVRLGDSSYRAAAARLLAKPETKLVALTPRSAIEDAVDDLRRTILLAALAALASVAVVAYAAAPAVARGRLSLQRRAQAARVLSNVADGVALVDPGGTIRFWNPAAEAITGLRASDVVGRRVDHAVRGWAGIAERVRNAAGAGERGQGPRAQTMPVEVGGRELWLSFTGVDFADGTVYTFRDLTDERRLDEAKNDFVATVSHELRTPLAAIYGAAVTLRSRDSELDDERREDLLAMVSEQSERLAGIVDEILLARALLPGTTDVAVERFDAVELARDVIETFRPRLPNRLSIDFAAPLTAPPVEGDRDKVRQVLVNLIENAIKYTPGGGRIEVGLEPRETHMRFHVRDEGLGIPVKEQERIFEKFYRLDPKLTLGTGGIGLGLYIARELVRHMDGRIWVTSKAGVGSTFFFELPLAEREDERPEIAAREVARR